MSSNTVPVDVLITGASGYLGTLLAGHLAARGCRVRALVRQRPIKPLANVVDTLDWQSARREPKLLTEFLAGVASVIHLAASSSTDAGEQLESHVQMPGALLSAAAQAGVQRFIATSSIKAIAGEAANTPLDLGSPPAPTSAYGRYKLQAEQTIAEHPANTELASWILRLPMLYGGGERGNFGLLCKVARSGLPLPVAADNRRSWLYTENLFSCIERIMTEPLVNGSTTLHVADQSALSTKALFQLIAAAQNSSGRCITLSARWADRLASIPVLAGLSARLLGSLELDLASLEALPDWVAPFTTEEAIAAELGGGVVSAARHEA